MRLVTLEHPSARTLSEIGSVRCLAAAGAAALLSRLNKALGLTIPPALLARPDQTIE